MKSFFLLAISFSLLHFASAQTGRLIVIVKSVQVSKGGELSTGIFTKPNFPKVGQQLLGNATPVNAAEMRIVFESVPVGVYAVVSFQDIDKNKDLKTNFVGYPKEPIGFSRDAKIKLGPPDFEDAKIKIEKDKVTTIVITLN